MEDDGTLATVEPSEKRPKLARKGGIVFRSRSSALPVGPTTFEGLMDWPSFVLQEVMTDESRRQRLLWLFRMGLSVTTAYSGMDAPREALTQLAEAMRVKFDFWPQIEYVHSCDIAELPQKVLLWLAKEKDFGISCVFSDLEDRLPEDAKSFLQSTEPESTCDKAEKAEAYKKMWEYLRDNRHACFHQLSTSQCLVHQRQCRVLGPSAEADSQETPSFSPGQSQSLVPQGPWKPFKLNIAGTVCKGWSMAGGRAMFSHPSERPHAIWLAERLARVGNGAEDGFVQECTVAYPADTKLRAQLEETHEVKVVITGPEAQGWPTSRPRSFTFGFNKQKWVWVGPSTDMAIQQEFDFLFSRSTELTGDVFFQASMETVRSDVFARLKKRGGAADVGQELRFDRSFLDEMLPPGALQRLAQYEATRPAKQGIESGAFLCDVQQWPEAGCSTAGPFFPCQLTHATVVSLNKMRPAVGLEYLAAQGFHVFPKPGDVHSAVALPLLKDMPTEKLVALSGNSMSLPALSAWMVYALSNIQRVEQFTEHAGERVQ